MDDNTREAASLTDLNKQGFTKQSMEPQDIPEDWLWTFYKDACQWCREQRSQSAIAARNRYGRELIRRGLLDMSIRTLEEQVES